MKKPIKKNLIFYSVILLFAAGLIFYIYSAEKMFVKKHKENLQQTAHVVSKAVWTIYTDATDYYLHQILSDRKYKNLTIITMDNTKIVDISSELESNLEKTLLSLGLIRTLDIESTIYYNGKDIGTVRATAYNTLIFKHLNAVFISSLMLIILWFALKLYESKAQLEQRVRERTTELNENKDRLAFALSAARSGIWDWDINTGDVFFDDNYYTIAGYEPGDFPYLYSEWQKRVHPDNLASAESAINDYISGKTDLFSVDFKFKKADGGWMWVLAQGKIAAYDHKGKPKRFIGTHTDITHVIELTRELEMSEERYETIFGNNHSAMLLIDHKTGYIADANPAAIKYYGYSKTEMLSKKISELNTLPENIIQEKMIEAYSGITNSLVSKHKLASGELRDVEVFTGPIVFKEKTYLFSIIHDITKRIKAETELQKLNKTLRVKIESEIEKNRKQEEIIHNQKKLADMGEMLSSIAHQWRQPLNALGFCVQDVTEAFENSEVNSEYLKKFETDAMNIIQHLSGTIDDFRYFFQPDKKAAEMNVAEEILSLMRLTMAQLQSSNIKASVTCACKNLNFLAEDKLKNKACSHLESTVFGYRGEFKQVIANLIYNSIDAVKNISGERFININLFETDNLVTITITDNGGGVPENIADKIFNPYFSTKKDSKGTGIGLYMSKTIIEEHMKGKIYFENTDSGANFIIELPTASFVKSKVSS